LNVPLPSSNCLIAALATPVTGDFRPDVPRLAGRARMLLEQGCDGITLFGTTGEGPEFSVEDRIAALAGLISAGIEPGRLIVSVSALAMADVVTLSAHATAAGVDGVLLMPPCVYRSGMNDNGTFCYYSTILEQLSNPLLRLYLYHFPDISGVPINPQVVRRLDERYSGLITGIKDSGGDVSFTQDLVRRFSHLSVFTGTEIHLPEVLALGGRGTICGLANLMPRLLRAIVDAPTAFDGRAMLPYILAGDMILSRASFIPSIKAVVAEVLSDPDWRRVVPPMTEVSTVERQRMVSDFLTWDAGLPQPWQSIASPLSQENIVRLHRSSRAQVKSA
jgi:4-hydroxy-tetrahydrodipicolinate synthase